MSRRPEDGFKFRNSLAGWNAAAHIPAISPDLSEAAEPIRRRLPNGEPVATFFRLDLGDTPADHHTLALALSVLAGYGHSAYEVVDADAVGMGQRVMSDRGWTHDGAMGAAGAQGLRQAQARVVGARRHCSQRAALRRSIDREDRLAAQTRRLSVGAS